MAARDVWKNLEGTGSTTLDVNSIVAAFSSRHAIKTLVLGVTSGQCSDFHSWLPAQKFVQRAES